MDHTSCNNFRERLKELQNFPCIFPFKFIVPAAKLEEAKALFPDGTVSVRNSRGGKYTSVSADIHVENADIVLAVYEKACAIKGLIAL